MISNNRKIEPSPIIQFSGTIGLLYNNDELTWSLNDVKKLIKKYIFDNKLDLCIGISNIETLCYKDEDNYIEEPIVRIYGDLSYYDEYQNKIVDILHELFIYLKVNLKQSSVIFNYNGLRIHASYCIC